MNSRRCRGEIRVQVTVGNSDLFEGDFGGEIMIEDEEMRIFL